MSDVIERMAEGIYNAMMWAYEDGSGNVAPKWVPGGNSHAQAEARNQACAALLEQLRTVMPVRKEVWGDVEANFDNAYYTIKPSSGEFQRMERAENLTQLLQRRPPEPVTWAPETPQAAISKFDQDIARLQWLSMQGITGPEAKQLLGEV
jgi:hypothetical protein